MQRNQKAFRRRMVILLLGTFWLALAFSMAITFQSWTDPYWIVVIAAIAPLVLFPALLMCGIGSYEPSSHHLIR
jgi:hypothetical protein